MAKTTKNATKKAVENKSVSASIKKQVKQIKAEPETKKITAKPEAKKITAAKEAKKITTAKEAKKLTTAKAPEKISTKPEPKKLTTKETVKIETKDAKKKQEVKATVKKTTVDKKAPVKQTEKKTASKKPIKMDADKKMDAYEKYTLEECLTLMQKMGVMHSYEDYKDILLGEADFNVIEKNIITGNQLSKSAFSFKKNGYDLDLIKVTLQKVADSMDVKAADFQILKKDINAAIKTKLGKDDEKNAKEYLKELKLAEKLLMIGQRKNILTSEDVTKLIGTDVANFMKHFFDLAYEILPEWQYDDVKFYEDFAYAILSQFTDLYEKHQLEILIECADLYIKHGDFLRGDESYGYILRDNQIKDYIYYRFASIYEDFDIDKAKRIAYEALQYVDERFMYYPNIMKILDK